jgi:hypothetical protein
MVSVTVLEILVNKSFKKQPYVPTTYRPRCVVFFVGSIGFWQFWAEIAAKTSRKPKLEARGRYES